MKQRHPQQYFELTKNSPDTCKELIKSKTIEDHFEAQTKLSRTSSCEHKDLAKSVTYFLCKDMLPAYTVEKSGFVKMLAKFNPHYDLPSRNYFSRVAIPSLYSEVKSDIQQQIINGLFFYTGTTDLWSSLTSEPYLSHYIDKQWNLCGKCLQTHYMPEAHPGINLQEALESTLSQWGLDPEKQVCITTDSGANIKLACQLLG